MELCYLLEQMELEKMIDYDDQSPIEEVALTVPTTDDPSLPVLTFRMWVLGLASCVLLSVFHMFFSYRSEPIGISSLSAQIITLPLGRLMAATLPTTKWRMPFTSWKFSLNPGPFNVKEHVLITIVASAGAGGPYAVHIVTVLKAFYKRHTLNFFVACMVTVTTQVMGFGFAGMFRKFLVEPAHMWWPSNLVTVSLFKALHNREERPKGGLTRNQFFLIVLIASFCYYTIPGYLFKMMTCFSFVCYIFPRSVFANQLGSGTNGFGFGSIGFDWATVSGFLGSPLQYPFFVIVNTMVGFILTLYVVVPIVYWKFNAYNAKTFPIFSTSLFSSDGERYNTTRVINKNFEFDTQAYDSYSMLNIPIMFTLFYGIGFASLASTLSHVALFHGKEIWNRSKLAWAEKPDVHTRLMRKYKQVPYWWFLTLLGASISLSILACEYYNEQLQLRWWGVLLAAAMALFFLLPIGVITAATSQTVRLNVITEYVIGYIYPGKPVAVLCFKTYGTISVAQAITLLSDFKIGHYMKIPPRSMFLAQVIGTLIASLTYLSTAWFMLSYIPNICQKDALPSDSPWTCPNDGIFFSASVIWGVVGPKRIFGTLGLYKQLNWCFLFGAISPVPIWLLRKQFPHVKWLQYIIMPVIISGASLIPPAGPVNYFSWFFVGLVFNYWMFRSHKKWWQRYNYLLSAALDAGVAFMGVLLYLLLGLNDKRLSWWGSGINDQCPLADCPTAPGVKVGMCPIY